MKLYNKHSLKKIKKAFFDALSNYDKETLDVLLTSKDIKYPININEYDNYYSTPLLWAASFGSLDSVKYLLESDDISPKTDIYIKNEEGENAFLCAVKNNKLDTVKYLLYTPTLKECFDINSTSTKGYNALVYSLHNSHHEITKYLLSSTDINVHHRSNNNGWTPLRSAILRENSSIIQHLLFDKNVEFNNYDILWLTSYSNKSSEYTNYVLDLLNKRETYYRVNNEILNKKNESSFLLENKNLKRKI